MMRIEPGTRRKACLSSTAVRAIRMLAIWTAQRGSADPVAESAPSLLLLVEDRDGAYLFAVSAFHLGFNRCDFSVFGDFSFRSADFFPAL